MCEKVPLIMRLRHHSSERGSALGAFAIFVGVVVGLLLGLVILIRIDDNIRRTAMRFVLDHERRTGQQYHLLRSALGLDLGFSEEEFWKRLRNRELEPVSLLIQAGFNVNQSRDQGETPLTFAVSEGLNDFVELFIQRGVDLNATNDQGATALMIAIERQNRPLVERLLARRVETNKVRMDGVSPLLLAAAQDDLKTAELLLIAGANMSYQDGNGRTPLHLAAGRRNLPMAKLFLDRGANFNLPDAKGYSPLMVAVSTRNAPLVQMLVEKGADPERRNEAGLNARELAYQVGWVLTMTPDRRVSIRERGGQAPPRDAGVVQEGVESEVPTSTLGSAAVETLPLPTGEPFAAGTEAPGREVAELPGADDGEYVDNGSAQLPHPDTLSRSKIKVGDAEYVVPEDPIRPRASNPIPYGIAPRGPSKQLTTLRVIGNPEGLWENAGGLILKEVKVKVRNNGEYEAKSVGVKVRLPGGGEEGLGGPNSLKPGETAEYKAGFSKPVKSGNLKAVLSCENCR